jgi:NADPH-dependent curcumin reductase CurA
VNYKRGALKDALHAACPDGVDLFFDNVGGEGFEAALDLINLHARIVICGAIGGYEADGAQPGRAIFLTLTKEFAWFYYGSILEPRRSALCAS